MKALGVIDSHLLQNGENFLGFHEFTDNQNIKLLAQAGQITHQRAIDLGIGEIAHEGAVDFDEFEMQFAQIMEKASLYFAYIAG